MVLLRRAVQRHCGNSHAAQDLVDLMIGHTVLHAGRRLLLVEILQDAVHGIIGTFAWHVYLLPLQKKGEIHLAARRRITS